MRARLSMCTMGLLAAIVCGAQAGTRTTVDTTNKWVWSVGSGWLNCRIDPTNGVAVGEYVLSGYMYSPTIGWVGMGDGTPTNGIRYLNNSSSDWGVNHDGKGHLSGFAWNDSAGWINYDWSTNTPDAVNAPKLDLQTGYFSGSVWGGSLGWITLSNSSARLRTASLTNADVNANGIPDSWEIQQMGSTNALGSGTNDWDHDGMSDAGEYTAGTNPKNSNDVLHVRALTLSGGDLYLSWASTNSRFYYVDCKTNLLDSTWQTNLLGMLSSDTPTNTVRKLTNNVGSRAFFRIRAALPPLY